MFSEGTKVVAFPNGEKRIGFILDGPHGEDEKYTVQIGSEVHHGFGFRVVPGDAEGETGQTFRKVGVNA
jgi:hypothetical protein